MTENSSTDPGAAPAASDLRLLDRLLAELGRNGLRVGTLELNRIYRALESAPPLGPAEMRQVLRACIVNRSEDADRFDEVFERWVATNDPVLRRWLRPEGAQTAPDHAEENAGEDDTPAGGHPQADSGRDPARSRAPIDALNEAGTAQRADSRLLARTTRALAILAVAGLLAIALASLWPDPTPIVQPPPRTEAPPPEAKQPGKWQRQLASYYWTWAPGYTLTTAASGTRSAPALAALGLGALLALGVAVRNFLRRRNLPAPAPPTREGPRFGRFRAPAGGGAALAHPARMRQAAWAVEKFAAEDLTRDLDIERTVAATARAGGVFTLHRERARHLREVWIWTDVYAGDPRTERYLATLIETLERHGISVRVGRFWGDPTLVRWRQGEAFDPRTVEGHRTECWLFLVSDGADIARALTLPREKVRMHELLASLAEWPRAYLVSPGPRPAPALARVAERYRIDHLGLTEVPVVLAHPHHAEHRRNRERAGTEAKGQRFGDVGLWLGALALAEQAPSLGHQLALHRALGLRCDPWSLGGEIFAEGRSRTAAVNGLITQSGYRARLRQGRGAESLVGRALDYRREYLDGELEHLRAGDAEALGVWSDTPAARRLRLERALLGLWDRPADAIEALYSLWQSEALGNDVTGVLERYSFSPQDAERKRVLPWAFTATDFPGDLPAAEIQRLAFLASKMGLGADPARSGANAGIPGTLGLGGGLLLGVAAGALTMALLPPAPPAPEMPAIFDRAPLGPTLFRFRDPDSGITWLGTPKDPIRVPSEVDHRIEVRWEWSPAPARVPAGDPTEGNELWLAGYLANPIRPCTEGWPGQSLAIIEADPADPPARELAATLLDRGSADRVLIGPRWPSALDTLLQPAPPPSTTRQLLIVQPAEPSHPAAAAALVNGGFAGPVAALPVTDFAELARAIGKLRGAATLSTPRSAVADPSNRRRARYRLGEDSIGVASQGLRVEGEVQVHGYPPVSDPGPNGIAMVTMCPGTFVIGSPTSEEDRDAFYRLAAGDPHPEQPRVIAMSGFQIALTETTSAQYRPNEGGPEAATDISWTKAEEFCQGRGYELPTEAQWEYAARGGSTTAYPYGDAPASLEGYAERRSFRIAPPGNTRTPALRPNPAGLYDMHGNALEWVRDCYGPTVYRAGEGPAVDPVADPVASVGDYPDIEKRGQACAWRVLRGGSAFDDVRFLRSAVRSWNRPDDRNDNIGFRCSRSPRQLDN